MRYDHRTFQAAASPARRRIENQRYHFQFPVEDCMPPQFCRRGFMNLAFPTGGSVSEPQSDMGSFGSPGCKVGGRGLATVSLSGRGKVTLLK
jgi:hypothetical protein